MNQLLTEIENRLATIETDSRNDEGVNNIVLSAILMRINNIRSDLRALEDLV